MGYSKSAMCANISLLVEGIHPLQPVLAGMPRLGLAGTACDCIAACMHSPAGKGSHFPSNVAAQLVHMGCTCFPCFTGGGPVVQFQGCLFVAPKKALTLRSPIRVFALRHLDQQSSASNALTDADLLSRFLSRARLFRLLYALR